MGVCYYVACHDCKKMRDLDKFYLLLQRDMNCREDALQATKDLNFGYQFRSVLLVNFMGEHMGHSCTVFPDHDLHEGKYDDYDEEFDKNFWGVDEDLLKEMKATKEDLRQRGRH